MFVSGKPVADVWSKDVLPMLSRLYDEAEREITPGTPAEERIGLVYYKQALKDFVELLGGSIQLGQGAIRRLAERKFGRIAGLHGDGR
jgi:hypothetical protein